jgi:asparagine synthase (glutamine-hydrolysing)
MPDDLLLKADRMSTAHSLELRVPFLDHKRVEFCQQLPPELKIRRGINKYLLRKWMKPFLPRQILHAPKRGFQIPTKSWLRGVLEEFVRDRLLATHGPCVSFFPKREVARVIEEHRSRDCSDQIYAVFVFDHPTEAARR